MPNGASTSMSESNLPSANIWNENPWARMSFSRLAAYKRCPAWYMHVGLEWHATWTSPEQEAGHIVQDVLQAVFDNTPATDVTATDLEARAAARVQLNFSKEWAKAAAAYAANPNAVGSFNISEEKYGRYARRGLDFHTREVQSWLEDRHPRSGARLGLPAYGAVGDAWVAVRPWHAPEVVAGGFWNEVIPQGWFQGQYDLVYEWTGGRRIVDLKASAGTSVFSTEIELQLLAYAFMERALGRGSPEGLEGWFLGAAEPKVFAVPNKEATDAFGEFVKELLVKSAQLEHSWKPEDFPAAPAQVAGFEKPAGAASAWCGVCPAAWTCKLSGKQAPSAGAGVALGAPLPQGNSMSAEGLVCGIKMPKTKQMRDGSTKVTRRITLVNEGGYSSFTWDERDMQRLLRDGLRAGRVVRLQGLKSWAPPHGGHVQYYAGAQTRLEVLSEAWRPSGQDAGVIERDAPALGE
ncbi:MAG: hypothetical protein EXS14_09145 [Planctomycetes bacterium]|nr:hypothetical protein [Planctomycetota bacterium]